MQGFLQKLLSRGAYPSALLLAPVLGFVAMNLGAHPGLVLVATTVATIAFVALLERAIPYRDAWTHNHGDVATDSLFGVSSLLVPALWRGVADGLGITAATFLPSGLWPSELPIVVQVAIAFVIADLGAWAGHRLVHRVPLLWRFHEVHHSVRRLYWLNSQHFHPLDLTLIHAASVTPLLLLGVGPEVLVLAASLSTVNALFQHCNARVEAGPLNWIFSTAQLHRWHHVHDADHGHANYGAGLIVWDVLAGTRRLPTDAVPDDLGAQPFPRRFWQQLLRPFSNKEVSR